MKKERERKCVIRGLNTRRRGQNERTEECSRMSHINESLLKDGQITMRKELEAGAALCHHGLPLCVYPLYVVRASLFAKPAVPLLGQ